MLAAAGREGRAPAELGHRSTRPSGSRCGEVDVPGDFSSAAPFIVAATLAARVGALTSHDVGLNPRRTGLLDVLERMGARIGVFNRRRSRRRAGRRPRGALGRARRDDGRRRRGADASSTSCRSSRSSPAVAHGNSAVRRRRGAAREGDRPDRHRDDCPTGDSACGSRSARWLPVRGVPTRPGRGVCDVRGRPPDRDARGGRRPDLRARGSSSGAPEAVAVSFPGFFDVLESVTQR